MAVTITDCWPRGTYQRSAPMQIATRYERLMVTSRSSPLKISCSPITLSLLCRCKGELLSTVISFLIDVLLATGVTMYEAMNPRVFKRACCSLPRTMSSSSHDVLSSPKSSPLTPVARRFFIRGSGGDRSRGLGPDNLEETPQVALNPELYIAIQYAIAP